jgi:hypothetical protein
MSPATLVTLIVVAAFVLWIVAAFLAIWWGR